MLKSHKGFSLIEILVAVAVLALIVTAGWLAYERYTDDSEGSRVSNSPEQAQEVEDADLDSIDEELEYKTTAGINYTTPSGWENAEAPYEPHEVGSGSYLLSPDYKEAGLGQLKIEEGAYIHFKEADRTGISADTSIDQAVETLRNGQEGYYDPSSVEVNRIDGERVITFDSGHTTDGVTSLHKSDGTWLEASFSTVHGNDAENNARQSSHYDVYTDWLEHFVELN